MTNWSRRSSSSGYRIATWPRRPADQWPPVARLRISAAEWGNGRSSRRSIMPRCQTGGLRGRSANHVPAQFSQQVVGFHDLLERSVGEAVSKLEIGARDFDCDGDGQIAEGEGDTRSLELPGQVNEHVDPVDYALPSMNGQGQFFTRGGGGWSADLGDGQQAAVVLGTHAAGVLVLVEEPRPDRPAVAGQPGDPNHGPRQGGRKSDGTG